MWIWLKACVATGTPWPAGGFPTAAVLQLFLHLQGAQISSHWCLPSRGSSHLSLTSEEAEGTPSTVGSESKSSFCAIYERTCLSALDTVPTAHTPASIWVRAPWLLVRRQQRLFWQHSSSWWFLQMEIFHSKAIHALGEISKHNQWAQWLLLEPLRNYSLVDKKWVTWV